MVVVQLYEKKLLQTIGIVYPRDVMNIQHLSGLLDEIAPLHLAES